MAGVFISGFSGTSSGAVPGTDKMEKEKDQSKMPNKKLKPTEIYEWDETDEACAYIKGAIETDPCQPVVIIGHSLGGDTAVQVAECLNKSGICVDLLIQIESVGVEDEKKPKNVNKGVNIWSRSREGINGASWVEGSENIAIDNSTHTDIDEPNDDGTVKNGGSEHDGLNTWGLIKKFINNLSEPYCNCPKEKQIDKKISQSNQTNLENNIKTVIDNANRNAVSIEELENNLETEAQFLIPSLRKLIKDKVIDKVKGERKVQYFISKRNKA